MGRRLYRKKSIAKSRNIIIVSARINHFKIEDSEAEDKILYVELFIFYENYALQFDML